MLAAAPPERRPPLKARIDEIDDRIAALRRDLQTCIDVNTPGVPPPPPPPPPPLPEVRLTKGDLDREVYLSIARTADAATDVVAGILDRFIAARPNVSAAQLTQAAQTVAALIAANFPDSARDRAPNAGFRMAQILATVVPKLDDPPLRRAAGEFTRAFLGGFRAGSVPQRQIQPLDLQFDRLAGVQRLRHDVWQRIYDAAAARPAVATAINSGPLGSALKVATTDSAAEAVAKAGIPTLPRSRQPPHQARRQLGDAIRRGGGGARHARRPDRLVARRVLAQPDPDQRRDHDRRKAEEGRTEDRARSGDRHRREEAEGDRRDPAEGGQGHHGDVRRAGEGCRPRRPRIRR